MPLSLCMLAYHLYTLSKPVSPNSMCPVVNGLQRYYNFRATQAPHPIFFDEKLVFYWEFVYLLGLHNLCLMAKVGGAST